MARTIKQPSTATQPNTGAVQPATDGRGPLVEQDQRDEQNQSGDNNERRGQGLTAVRNEQDDSRDNSDDREVGESREDRKFGDKRGFGENHDRREPDQLGEHGEQDSRPEPWPSMSGADAYGPVLEAWKHVFRSWSELAETMVKAQQQTFAAMMGAANPSIKDIANGEHRRREHALSGPRSGSGGPDRIDHDRR
jgi:hypothetical protein